MPEWICTLLLCSLGGNSLSVGGLGLNSESSRTIVILLYALLLNLLLVTPVVYNHLLICADITALILHKPNIFFMYVFILCVLSQVTCGYSFTVVSAGAMPHSRLEK